MDRMFPYEVLIEPPSAPSVTEVPKLLSFWVLGANFPHQITVLFQKQNGEPAAELMAETLHFSGWKEVKLSIPPEVTTGEELYLGGIKLYMDPNNTFEGTYYVYFDNFSVWKEHK